MPKIVTKKYKDYPHTHSFLAGHFGENSIPLDVNDPLNSREAIKNYEVAPDEIPLFEEAEKLLAAMGKSQAALCSLGYQHAMCEDYAILEARDDQSRETAMRNYAKRLGVDHDVIRKLVDTIY